MCAVSMTGKAWRDQVAGELAERAFPVLLRQGVKANSVDVELGVWKAIQRTLPEVGCSEETPAHLTEAVYQVALDGGFAGPFIDLELALWQTFTERRRMKETLAV